jgi:hypothetical protein
MFRWCKYCDLPAASKNFERKHLKGQCIGKSRDKEKHVPASGSSRIKRKRDDNKDHDRKARAAEKRDGKAVMENGDVNEEIDTTAAMSSEEGGLRRGTDHNEARNRSGNESSASSLEDAGNDHASKASTKTGKTKLLSQWDLLLLDRPARGDEEATADWLLKVMRVSNQYTFGVDSSERDPLKLENASSRGIPFEQAVAQGPELGGFT